MCSILLRCPGECNSVSFARRQAIHNCFVDPDASRAYQRYYHTSVYLYSLYLYTSVSQYPLALLALALPNLHRWTLHTNPYMQGAIQLNSPCDLPAFRHTRDVLRTKSRCVPDLKAHPRRSPNDVPDVPDHFCALVAQHSAPDLNWRFLPFMATRETHPRRSSNEVSVCPRP